MMPTLLLAHIEFIGQRFSHIIDAVALFITWFPKESTRFHVYRAGACGSRVS